MNLNPLFPDQETLGIFTDLYELTMAAAYVEAGCHEQVATFELFTRKLPDNRNFLIAAGLPQGLHFILQAGFSGSATQFLRDERAFAGVSDEFFKRLEDFRFSGTVRALPEGTIFFAGEPILQVTAPVLEAQIVETYLISSLNVQSMVATKAARLCGAAGGRPVVDFGTRRAHGPQAGLLAARAAYLGGCAGTSNVLAGYLEGIPLVGTMAHSFVQFFESEKVAFQTFQRTFPDHSILLVDTYDTLEGVRKAISLRKPIQGIRLDSGNLLELAQEGRRLLDAAGLRQAKIFASGNLDEAKLGRLHLENAPIDAYGVGTDLVVSPDAPGCDLVYKLVEVHRKGEKVPAYKTSEQKATLPFRKQIWRTIKDGKFQEDSLAVEGEALIFDEKSETAPLLETYIEHGRLVREPASLEEARKRVQSQIDFLPESTRELDSGEPYPVRLSPQLQDFQKQIQKQER